MPDYDNECPNCGAPTGGGPCGSSYGNSGPSCADLMED